MTKMSGRVKLKVHDCIFAWLQNQAGLASDTANSSSSRAGLETKQKIKKRRTEPENMSDRLYQ